MSQSEKSEILTSQSETSSYLDMVQSEKSL